MTELTYFLKRVQAVLREGMATTRSAQPQRVESHVRQALKDIREAISKTRNIKCDHHGAESVSKTNLESAEKQKPPLQSRNTCYNTTQANKSSRTITRAFAQKKRNVRHYKQVRELSPIGKKQLNISVTMKWLCSFQLLR